MKAPPVRVPSTWLALREDADARARSRALIRELSNALPAPQQGAVLHIHDLAAGTGSMARWLAPLLPGPQHWLLHDLDAELLAIACARPPGPPSGAAPVILEPRRTDVMRLGAGDLAGADLITASALLDMLTERELTGLVAACAARACPVLLCLSVTGQVTLTPADPLDGRIAAAFNAHQRRFSARGELLGPDAATFAADAFSARGLSVRLVPTPWRLGPVDAQLLSSWFDGWLAAAVEQDSDLVQEAARYGAERRAQAQAGQLRVSVGHVDLLALPAVSQPASKRDDRA